MMDFIENEPQKDNFVQQFEKFILFNLEGETYGLPILQVQEIISEYRMTTMPNMPAFCHGVISLRGEAVPVINLRNRFGLSERNRDNQTRIIIAEVNGEPMGIQVDQVRRVATISTDEVDRSPALPGSREYDFFLGVAELEGGKFTMLLDIQKILTDMESIEIVELQETIRQSLAPDSLAPESYGMSEGELEDEIPEYPEDSDQPLPPPRDE
jgi:purine-binding chemotaxis protein CheW